MDSGPFQRRFVQVRRGVWGQPSGPLDPHITGAVNLPGRSPNPVETVLGVLVRSRRSYLARLLRSPIGVFGW